jgi:hypothetical protein
VQVHVEVFGWVFGGFDDLCEKVADEGVFEFYLEEDGLLHGDPAFMN